MVGVAIPLPIDRNYIQCDAVGVFRLKRTESDAQRRKHPPMRRKVSTQQITSPLVLHAEMKSTKARMRLVSGCCYVIVGDACDVGEAGVSFAAMLLLVMLMVIMLM